MRADLGVEGASVATKLRLAGVVLAGGESRRFGGDKYLAEVQGCAIVAKVVTAVASVPSVERVWLCLRSRTRWIELSRTLPASVEPLEDHEAKYRGPGAGLASATLRAAEEGYDGLLVVAGDMAWIEASALCRLVELGTALEAEAAAPLASSGLVPMVFFATIRTASEALALALVRGKPRWTDALRAARRLLLASVDLLGKPRWFADVDSREDLERPQDPEPFGEPLVIVEWRGGVPASQAARAWHSDPPSAVTELLWESTAWRNRGAHLLSLHAALDAILVAKSSGLRVREAELAADEARKLLEEPAGARG